jgi:hypothetical protein
MRHRSDRPFSRYGEPPTAYEVALLQEAAAQRDASVWALIGARIGAQALAVVLDELRGEKVWVPPREAFFASLYEPRRNARIVALRAEGHTAATIAKEFGLTPQHVNRIVRSAAGPTGSSGCGKGRRDD